MTYPLNCLLGSLVSHQWQATWKECNKWTAQPVGPKINQTELWTYRNQYLSLVIFHFNVHEFSELCIGTALCLAIRKKYKWHHREKYFHQISILIMQTQDNVKILMKFPSVLTFSNTTWQAWLWKGMQWFLERLHTAYNWAIMPDLGTICINTVPHLNDTRSSIIKMPPLVKEKEKGEHHMLGTRNQGCQWWEVPEAVMNI